MPCLGSTGTSSLPSSDFKSVRNTLAVKEPDRAPAIVQEDGSNPITPALIVFYFSFAQTLADEPALIFRLTQAPLTAFVGAFQSRSKDPLMNLTLVPWY